MGGEGARRLAPEADADLIFDPSSEGRANAFDRYADLYSAGTDVEATGGEFFAAVGAALLPGMAIFTRTLRGVGHRRDRGRIVRDGMEHFTIQLVRSGALMADADGETRIVGAGEGLLVDMTRPFRNRPAGRLFTLSVSRERIRDAGLEPAGLHGAPLGRDDGRLEQLLTSRRLPGDGDPVEAILREVRARLRPETDRAAQEIGTRQERARRFIEANLADPALSPGRIAVACGMSRATLYRAFEPLGGVSEWLQTRRLQHVRRLLADTAAPVAEAGRIAGFANPSHLTVAFQSRFGLTPSAFRQTLARPDRLDPGSAAAFALTHMGSALQRGGGAA